VQTTPKRRTKPTPRIQLFGLFKQCVGDSGGVPTTAEQVRGIDSVRLTDVAQAAVGSAKLGEARSSLSNW